MSQIYSKWKILSYKTELMTLKKNREKLLDRGHLNKKYSSWEKLGNLIFGISGGYSSQEYTS